jgi:hypothetical protein
MIFRKKTLDSVETLSTKATKLLRSASNSARWIYENLSIDLYDNQIEIVNAVLNPQIKNLAVMQARGAGKTFAVGIALSKLCVRQRGIKIGVFAPRADQAIRIIEEIRKNIIKPGTVMHSKINWKDSVKSRLIFNNGSEILAMSAAPTTKKEGWHFHVIVLDECHRIEDAVVNQHINPMLGSFAMAKTIKIGIPAAKNNFWKSCVASRDYTVLKRNWLECDILKTSGSFRYNGIDYPDHIVRKLSLNTKQVLFPDRPDLHYEGEYSDFEYKTQFAMEWVSDIDLDLNERQQAMLISGTHSILKHARPELKEHYFFGLDTAPGSLQPKKKDLDFTALSIWRKRGDNVKEKVACFEWQGDIVTQWEEIKKIIHPITGDFPCVFGIADHSNVAQAIIPFFKAERIPIEGIMFGRQESESKKNYKNAMFDEFKHELDEGRVLFPSLDTIDKNKVFKKSYNEWCNIERHIAGGGGINDKIKAPSDLHDDHCSADVLAVWAMDKSNSFPAAMASTYKIPTPKISSGISAQSRIMSNKKEDNRYLK